jgi:hypothetical protein
MQIPFFHRIQSAQRILIAGAGGGFDVASGIPLYMHLRALGKQVTLANLSFTDMRFSNCAQPVPGLYIVKPDSEDVRYFPERRILEWLAEHGESPAMYAFPRELGVQPLRACYAHMIEAHNIDTVVLVDGGTDSLMFGDEAEVGTIVEDAASIVAVAGLNLAQSYLMAVGFGVEHHLNHHACLQNMAALAKAGAFLGAHALTPHNAEGAAFVKLVDYLNARSPIKSIVTNGIVNAMLGEFGDVHASARSRTTEQFVSPLMSLCWYYELNAIANRVVFKDRIESSTTMDEVAKAVQLHRLANTRREKKRIPLI